jgi:hypothetical protein
MADPVATEVAITWAASAGCAFYLFTLYRSGGRGVGAQGFLVFVLAGLLLVRGFSWLNPDPRLIRLTFAFATWLPLAITLFCERVLRRHHPLAVKLFALIVSVGFFLSDIVANLPANRGGMAVFGLCFAAVVLVNGLLLAARRRAELSIAENQLANLLLLIALLSVPLVLSDFRTLIGFSPVRLGALAALLFVYSMLGAVVRNVSAWTWLGRFAMLVALALLLSMMIALAAEGLAFTAWWPRTLQVWPVAVAWLLLTGIVVHRRAIYADGRANAFVRWLGGAPLGSATQFLSTLGDSPDAASHVILQEVDLRDYDAGVLRRLSDAHDGVVSLSHARAVREDSPAALAESAEQWADLFERLQMTHGFIARSEPFAVVLVCLPAATMTAAAEQRLRVVGHLARGLEHA